MFAAEVNQAPSQETDAETESGSDEDGDMQPPETYYSPQASINPSVRAGRREGRYKSNGRMDGGSPPGSSTDAPADVGIGAGRGRTRSRNRRSIDSISRVLDFMDH